MSGFATGATTRLGTTPGPRIISGIPIASS